jgi:hypothetical protein
MPSTMTVWAAMMQGASNMEIRLSSKAPARIGIDPPKERRTDGVRTARPTARILGRNNSRKMNAVRMMLCWTPLMPNQRCAKLSKGNRLRLLEKRSQAIQVPNRRKRNHSGLPR